MRKKFYRSRENRFIAGVCGGIAEHFDLDPVIVRIIFVLLLMATGVFPFLKMQTAIKLK